MTDEKQYETAEIRINKALAAIEKLKSLRAYKLSQEDVEAVKTKLNGAVEAVIKTISGQEKFKF